MSRVRRIPGWGLMTETTACNCRSCYAVSVGLTYEAVSHWKGRRKCLLDLQAPEISPKVRKQMLLFIEAVNNMKHERKEVTN